MRPAANRPRVVVFGIGNPSRGDDALGPLLLERLERLSAPWVDIECVPAFQLQVENALDLVGRDLALFVDAAASGPAPFALLPVVPAPTTGITTHALAPGVVLAVYEQIHHQPPPPAFTLAVRGNEFELGAPLSPLATKNLEAAWAEMVRLLARPEAAVWTAGSAGAPAITPPGFRNA